MKNISLLKVSYAVTWLLAGMSSLFSVSRYIILNARNNVETSKNYVREGLNTSLMMETACWCIVTFVLAYSLSAVIRSLDEMFES